jgi:uncharacterized protein (TIGR02271 family)
MTHTVVGLFDDRSEAQAAMQELIQQGFIRENIDISNRSASETGNNTSNTTTSTGVGDSISNFFSSLFDDETTVTNFTNAASDADAVLAIQVESDERARLAAEILDRNGAIDVDERSARYGQQNFAQTSGTTQNTANVERNTADAQSETTIPVIEEELRVGKKQVERGGARIRSRIIEKPVEASVRLREEHIVVNRQPVNRAVTDTDLTNFQEGDIELTERAEVPVVGKQARVVEEINVGKQVEEREETVSDTVRRTDVEVEEIENNVTQGDFNTRKASN